MLILTNSNGGSSVFQLTLHKNLNAYPRILGVTNHMSIHVKPKHEILYAHPASVNALLYSLRHSAAPLIRCSLAVRKEN